MEVTITLTDPTIYTAPWVSRTTLRLNPTSEIGEYFCVPSDEELYKKVMREAGSRSRQVDDSLPAARRPHSLRRENRKRDAVRH